MTTTNSRRIALLTGASVAALGMSALTASPALAAPPHDAFGTGTAAGTDTTSDTVAICDLATNADCFFGVNATGAPAATANVNTTATGRILQHDAGATVTLSMKDYTFNGQNPTLRFSPGERVRFVVSNDEDTRVLHNFRIVGLDVPCGPPLLPGERRVVTVTMPRSPGEFVYTCCTHPGMGGKLVIAQR